MSHTHPMPDDATLNSIRDAAADMLAAAGSDAYETYFKAWKRLRAHNEDGVWWAMQFWSDAYCRIVAGVERGSTIEGDPVAVISVINTETGRMLASDDGEMPPEVLWSTRMLGAYFRGDDDQYLALWGALTESDVEPIVKLKHIHAYCQIIGRMIAYVAGNGRESIAAATRRSGVAALDDLVQAGRVIGPDGQRVLRVPFHGLPDFRPEAEPIRFYRRSDPDA